ncbi:hypothetical protein LP415_26125 [Polaromonas sp. P1(28)-8]|nr:hypothetical protein LP415_26125 [Polaromonas sp. P1(28)-8]
MKFINEAEAAIFTRLAQVVLPVAGSPLVPWTPDGLLQTLDGALLATMAPHILTGLKGGMQYFNDGPVALYKKRFTALDDAEATQFCDAWGNSNLPPQRPDDGAEEVDSTVVLGQPGKLGTLGLRRTNDQAPGPEVPGQRTAADTLNITIRGHTT